MAQEKRGGVDYFKLRFRRQGRQTAIGLGKRSWLVDGVVRELAELQAERRTEIKHKRLIATVRGLLRRAKCSMQAALQGTGYRFYGCEIRQRRRSSKKEPDGANR